MLCLSTGGVRARPWWILDAACLWGTIVLLTCNHNSQERNGVTSVRGLSQNGAEARMHPSVSQAGLELVVWSERVMNGWGSMWWGK